MNDKGDGVNMCKALEELENEGRLKGMREGIKEGEIQGRIFARFEDGIFRVVFP